MGKSKDEVPIPDSASLASSVGNSSGDDDVETKLKTSSATSAPTVLRRNGNLASPPGAYQVTPSGMLSGDDDDSHRHEIHRSEETLIAATLVNEDSSDHNPPPKLLVSAQPMVIGRNKKLRGVFFGLGGVLIIIIVASSLAVYFSSSKSSPSSSPTRSARRELPFAIIDQNYTRQSSHFATWKTYNCSITLSCMAGTIHIDQQRNAVCEQNRRQVATCRANSTVAQVLFLCSAIGETTAVAHLDPECEVATMGTFCADFRGIETSQETVNTQSPSPTSLQPTSAPSTNQPIGTLSLGPTLNTMTLPTRSPADASLTMRPTLPPTRSPTKQPIQQPMQTPTPSLPPTNKPMAPTLTTAAPSKQTTPKPTMRPSPAPTPLPTKALMTAPPSKQPTMRPTMRPSRPPTRAPTPPPTMRPRLTPAPTRQPLPPPPGGGGGGGSGGGGGGGGDGTMNGDANGGGGRKRRLGQGSHLPRSLGRSLQSSRRPPSLTIEGNAPFGQDDDNSLPVKYTKDGPNPWFAKTNSTCQAGEAVVSESETVTLCHTCTQDGCNGVDVTIVSSPKALVEDKTTCSHFIGRGPFVEWMWSAVDRSVRPEEFGVRRDRHG